MCRLFAYVHSGLPRSMRETLGDRVLDEFRQLSEVHEDGWGAVWVGSKALSSYVSTRCAARDTLVFDTLTREAVESAVVHERWASPGIGLGLDNQQPFLYRGLAFAHNGTISNEQGNVVDRPAAYREALGLVHSTTRSDSRLYADLFFLHLEAELGPRQPLGLVPDAAQVQRALVQTVATLRRDYPEASFNAVIETPEFTFAARIHPDHPRFSPGLRSGYEKARWTDRIDSYYELGYTTVRHAGSVTSVVSSSGYPSSDPWTRLPNQTLLVLRHHDALPQTVPLGA